MEQYSAGKERTIPCLLLFALELSRTEKQAEEKAANSTKRQM
jgi:hypothetical protein